MTGKNEVLDIDGAGLRVALVVSRFNEEITSSLAKGASAALVDSGVRSDDIVEVRVAGAFELAPACRQVVALRPRVDAIVALGAVIRGETPHFDAIVGAAANGLQRVAIDLDLPLTFGVLTTDTRDQAVERADPSRGDKGGEAARAALEQVAVYERLAGSRPAVQGFQSR